MSSPIIRLSVIRALRHSTGSTAGTALEMASMPVMAVEPDANAPYQQHGNGLSDGQLADRDGVESAACGVHQPCDYQGGDRRDEGVRRYGEHSPPDELLAGSRSAGSRSRQRRSVRSLAASTGTPR